MVSFPATILMATACHLLFLADSKLLPMSDPVRQGYSNLMQDLLSHPAVQFKIPPTPSVMAAINSSYIKQAIIIQIELFPTNILELNGNQEVMVMSVYLKITWNDTALTWNSSEYEGVTGVELQASQIWTPSLTIMNEVEEKMIILDESVTLSLTYMGGIMVPLDKHFRTYCKMNFMYFPFDKQRCEITFMTTTNTPVVLQPTTGLTENFMKRYNPGGEWEMTGMYWKQSGADDGPRPKLLVAIFNLERKTYFYALTLIGPMAISALMNCLVFAIPPNAGEKISFLISIFLSNTVFSGYLSDIMPHSFQKNVPLLMGYLVGLWLWSALVFLATLIVLHRSHSEQDMHNEAEVISPDKRTLICFKTFFSNIFNKRNKVFHKIQPVWVKNQLQPDVSQSRQNNLQRRTLVQDSTDPYCKKAFEESNCKDITSVMADCNHDLSVKSPKPCQNLQTKHSIRSQKKLKAKSLDQIFLCLSIAVLICTCILFFLQITGEHSFF